MFLKVDNVGAVRMSSESEISADLWALSPRRDGRLCDGTHTSFMCESDETHTTRWGDRWRTACVLWLAAVATATLNRLESWFKQWTERNKNDAAE